MIQLLKISIATSVVGSIFLFFYVKTLDPQIVSIGSIDSLGSGVLVQINGMAEQPEIRDKQYVFKLCELSCISVHASKELRQIILEGDRLTVTGITREFYGNSYLDAKKILP